MFSLLLMNVDSSKIRRRDCLQFDSEKTYKQVNWNFLVMLRNDRV